MKDYRFEQLVSHIKMLLSISNELADKAKEKILHPDVTEFDYFWGITEQTQIKVLKRILQRAKEIEKLSKDNSNFWSEAEMNELNQISSLSD